MSVLETANLWFRCRFNPFEWAQVSAQAHTRSLQELAALKVQANSEGDTIAKLKAQLDDFIKSKDEAETAMLRQFMELLNEKKRKIRDQNRLLAGAKVDESTGKISIVDKSNTVANQVHPYSDSSASYTGRDEAAEASGVPYIKTESKSSRAGAGARSRATIAIRCRSDGD